MSPGDDRGATILVGGKRALKVGDLMGTKIIPFFKLETDEDYEKLIDLARRMMDFFADNALEHERIGETIDRIGLPAFLEAMEIDPDPNMVNHPAHVQLRPHRRLHRRGGEIFRAQGARGRPRRRRRLKAGAENVRPRPQGGAGNQKLFRERNI